MLTIQTFTADETKRLGVQIGTLLRAGDCLCLTGTLGAGKTLLAQGIGEGLQVIDPITSPTFTVLQVYQGRLTLFHYDLYRLRQPEELMDIGFEEFSGAAGVTLIEWPDKFPEYMPEEALWIELAIVGETARTAVFKPHGIRYELLLKELRSE